MPVFVYSALVGTTIREVPHFSESAINHEINQSLIMFITNKQSCMHSNLYTIFKTITRNYDANFMILFRFLFYSTIFLFLHWKKFP